MGGLQCERALISQEALDRAATVPTALRALTIGLLPASVTIHMQQRHWHSLCNNLLVHPRSVIFIDAVFDAVRTIYRMVRGLTASIHGSGLNFAEAKGRVVRGLFCLLVA